MKEDLAHANLASTSGESGATENKMSYPSKGDPNEDDLDDLDGMGSSKP